MHRLLEQQIKQHVKDSATLQSLDSFLKTVDEVYNKTEQGQASSVEMFREAAWDASPVAMLSLDLDNNVVEFNQCFLGLWGILPEAAEANSLNVLIESAADQAVDPQAFWHCIGAAGSDQMFGERTLLLELTNGDFVEQVVTPIINSDNGRLDGRLCLFREVTDKRRNEQLPRHKGTHDHLTGLLNQLSFNDRLEHAIHRAERVEKHLAICHIDIDDFKAINSSEGYAAGNKILHAVSDRIQCCVRSQETLARFSGDDFVVLSEDIEEPREAVRLANRISQAFQRPFLIDGEEIYLTSCMGLTLYPLDSEDPRELIAQSREAVTEAKSNGKGSIALYNNELEAVLQKRRTIIRELHQAIENEELFLMFQPKANIDMTAIVGFEALVRWDHPIKGLMNPSDFIPVAEESQVIFELSRWVLGDVCKHMKSWQEKGIKDLPVSINLSIQELQAPDLCESFYEVIRESGIEPSMIEIEVSEGILVDNLEEGTTTLQALREVGFSVAVDNFGMGHSTMGILKNLPIDKIKIDRAFIRNISSSQKDAAIADSIITLGHNLGLKVVAEGVEDKKSAEALRSFSCDHIQGYLLSAPLQGDKLLDFISSYKG